MKHCLLCNKKITEQICSTCDVFLKQKHGKDYNEHIQLLKRSWKEVKNAKYTMEMATKKGKGGTQQ